MIKAARIVAILLAAAALGVWGAILLAPRPDDLPPVLNTGPAVRAPDVTPVALWFGRDQVLGTDVVVQGLISDGSRSAAVVTVNGGQPTAVSAGAQTPSGLVIRSVDAQGLTLDTGGASMRAAAPAVPPAPAGINPVKQ